ncbi:hypothetical protein [Streptomyces misionensis]
MSELRECAARRGLARVERRPRLQLMARFRVHYADGSRLALLTFRRRTVEGFRAVLG